jgi:hypothetical protein
MAEDHKKHSDLQAFTASVEQEMFDLAMLPVAKYNLTVVSRANAKGRSAIHTARLVGKLEGQTPQGGDLSDQLQILEMSAGVKKMMASQLYKDHQLLEADYEDERRLLDTGKIRDNERPEAKEPLASNKSIDQQKLSEHLKNLDQDQTPDLDKDMTAEDHDKKHQESWRRAQKLLVDYSNMKDDHNHIYDTPNTVISEFLTDLHHYCHDRNRGKDPDDVEYIPVDLLMADAKQTFAREVEKLSPDKGIDQEKHSELLRDLERVFGTPDPDQGHNVEQPGQLTQNSKTFDNGIDQQKLSEHLKNLDRDRERDPDKDREH